MLIHEIGPEPKVCSRRIRGLEVILRIALRPIAGNVQGDADRILRYEILPGRSQFDNINGAVVLLPVGQRKHILSDEVFFKDEVVRRAEVDTRPIHGVVPGDGRGRERTPRLSHQGTVGDDPGAGVLNDAFALRAKVEDKTELAKGCVREGYGASAAPCIGKINLIGWRGRTANGVRNCPGFVEIDKDAGQVLASVRSETAYFR